MILAGLTRPGTGFDLRDYVLFWPGVAAALIVALVASGALGLALRRSRLVAFGLIFSVGIVVAATLTPGRDALLLGIPGSGTCDLSGLRLPSPSDLRTLNDTSLNVLLFVPLGGTVFLAGWSRRAPVLPLATLALPFAIEAVQLVLTPLGRSCQGVDIVDNLTGLVLGAVLGAVARLASGVAVSPGGPIDPRT